MYNFTDTTTAPSGTFLPAEALQINGEYIDFDLMNLELNTVDDHIGENTR